MNKLAFILFASILLVSCGKTSNQQADAPAEEDTNKVLYNQVMDIHDEVMPRMSEIMSLKRSLDEKIKNTPDLTPEAKKELELKMASLDSAHFLMMDWMHKFQPDSLKGEELRAYLESEMERVKTVKTAMLDAIEQAKANQ